MRLAVHPSLHGRGIRRTLLNGAGPLSGTRRAETIINTWTAIRRRCGSTKGSVSSYRSARAAAGA